MRTMEVPLIVGAGPVGLGAALFLARAGRVPRIVEMRNEPSTESRALAINPRTLELLEPTGLTDRLLEVGRPIRGVQFHQETRTSTLVFERLRTKHPFMLALSQSSTERLLAGAFEAAGGRIERGVKMVECRDVSDGVEVVLESAGGGGREEVHCPWLLAADGPHSTARQQLGIAFEGTAFASDWYLADLPLETDLSQDHAHVFFETGGEFHFLIRVVESVPPPGLPVWRVIGNRPEPVSRIPGAKPAGPVLWTSAFRVAHRLAARFATAHVYLAGDAAHVHSPIGARGMNLGLEDAWVFAELARKNSLSRYNDVRRDVDKRVVRRVESLSRIADAGSKLYEFLRSKVLPRAVRTPILRLEMLATVTGTDHALRTD